MFLAGKWLNIEYKEGSEYDIAGKLMGLQAYGNHIEEFAKILPQSILRTNDIFDKEKWFRFVGNELVGTLKPLDWIRTVHNHMGDVLVKIF